MSVYDQGTITVTNGSVTVVGVGTAFLSSVRRGAVLRTGVKLRVVADIIDDTHLNLELPYDDATVAGMPYEIILNWADTSPTELARRIDQFLNDRDRSLAEFTDWTNGVYDGGPNGDGKYPLTDRWGNVTLVKSPGRLEYEAGSGGGGTGDLSGANIWLASEWGVLGGVNIDESDNLATAMRAVGEKGGGILVVRSHNGTDPIRINKLINIEHSNTTVKFESPVAYGAYGGLRISGGQAETLRPGMTEMIKLRLPSTTDAEGRMVLPCREGNGSFLKIGDRLTIRGQNDKTGAVLEKQISIVVAINGDDITMADEPDYTFKPTYPESEYPEDRTTGTTIAISIYTQMTADTKGTDIIPVGDVTGFNAGDLVYISDARTETDMMAPVVTNLRSAGVMEILRIAAVDPVAKTLRMERALRREYLTAWAAGVVKMDAVKNSHIIMKDVYWVEEQPGRKVHGAAINYGWACSIKVADMYGRGGRKGQGMRVAYSYDCHVVDSRVYDAFSFLSAEGYGISLYYSTLCSVHNCSATGNRHNILLQTVTSCDIFDNVSNDDYISGIDLHGAGSVDCRIMRNRVSRSRSYADGVTNGGGIRNGNTSHTIGDHNTVIADNYIEGYLDDKCAAIDVSPSSKGVIVRNNDIIDSRIGFRHYKIGSSINPGQYSDRVLLENNRYTRVTQPYDINNYDNSVITEIVALNETSIDNSTHFTFKKVPKLTIMGAKIVAPRSAPGVAAFDIQDCGNVKAYDCYAGEADRGFYIKNSTYVKMVRNLLGDVLSTGIVDGGGNGTVINLQNTDAPAGGGGGGAPVKLTRINGSLADRATSSDPVNLNTSTPSIADGFTAVQGSVNVEVGSVIDVYAFIPYVSLGGTTGPVTAHLWADGVRVATSVDRLTASSGAENNGGKDFTLIASFIASEPVLDVLVKIGPNSNTNTLMFNSKFNGESQPYIVVKEYPQ